MKRIQWLDIAKFFFIMTVMYSHLESAVDEFSCLIVPFMLPGFLFASGYSHKAGQHAGIFFRKKIRTLFIPWLILSVFDISLSRLVSFSEHNFLYELGWNLLQIRGKHDQLWFVAALFTAYIPFYFYIEWYNKKAPSHKRRILFILLAFAIFGCGIAYSSLMNPQLLPWGTSALPWHIDYAFRAVFFMACGYFFREYFEAYFDIIPVTPRAIVLFIIHAAIVYAPYFCTIPNAIFSILANLITPLLGILFVVALSKILPAYRYFIYIGQNTLLYFAFHGKAYGVLEGLARNFLAGPYNAILASKPASIAFAVIMTVLVSVLLIIPCWIVNRYFPFVLGRKRSESSIKLG